MIHSILSVLAGFALLSVLIMIATVVACRLMLGVRGRQAMMNVKPTRAFIFVNLVYSAFFGVVGGFVTATIADHARFMHAVALAGLIFAMAVFSFFGSARSPQPKGYGVALMVLGPACAVLGGYLQGLVP